MAVITRRIVFDSKIPGWTNFEKYNVAFIRHVEGYCNDKLKVLG